MGGAVFMGLEAGVRLDGTELRLPLADAEDAYERAIPDALEVPQ